MRKTLFSYVLLLSIILLAGCTGGHGHSGRRPSSLQSENGQEERPKPQAGQLTTSEWSELKNYEFYLSLFTDSQNNGDDQDREEGVFLPYINDAYFDTLNRIVVTVNNGDTPIHGAKVELIGSDQRVIYRSMSNANGIAYLFPRRDEVDDIAQILVKHNGQTILRDYSYSTEQNELTLSINSPSNHLNIIELMFVIDTTGSMSDELEYIKAEIDYVISEVKEALPDTQVKLALVFYRDHGDTYVTRTFDFTTDISKQKKNLSKQSANGGGDYPEAVDEALTEAVNLSWSSENTTKILFHVLDAPPHDEQEKMTRYQRSIMTASEMGIRMIPVASSGINKYTEFLLRNEAMMTGGTYVFLTDDSGIGNDHLEASVGETVVEYLNLLMIRLIKEYHTGIEGEKIPYYNNQQQSSKDETPLN